MKEWNSPWLDGENYKINHSLVSDLNFNYNISSYKYRISGS